MSEIAYPRILPAADCSIIVEFGNEINEEINARIAGFSKAMSDGSIKGIIEVIPTYRSALITYNPRIISYGSLCETIRNRITGSDDRSGEEKRIVEIPVCYGGSYGPDIAFVAEHAGMSEQEVIELHSSKDYLIYMLGFQPGFPYLGGLDERLVTPRLSAPRPMIPEGSVGIGGSQTGIYSVASPAGWQLLGITPVKVYNPKKTPAIPYEAGDYIRFVPISEKEFLEIEEAEKNCTYDIKIRVEN